MKNSFFRKAKSALCLISAVFAFALFFGESAFSQSFNRDNSRIFYKANVSANSLIGLDDAEYEIFNLVNGERRKRRMTDLDWDDRLASLARRFSEQMARQNFFSHFDRDGKSVADRANSARIKNWSRIGENLFYCEGVDDFDSLAVRGWMKSAGHRQNILDNSWTTTGIGVAESRDGRIYVTQIFIER
jgi:uncharacterized protein YkwD